MLALNIGRRDVDIHTIDRYPTYAVDVQMPYIIVSLYSIVRSCWVLIKAMDSYQINHIYQNPHAHYFYPHLWVVATSETLASNISP